ncbi:hypothetical protein C8F04DRAFT_361436 [Mycena alexandri]|uniref:Uncharacterized protein n=1 Tax=Mycena alexandri TaxID=1745969 RepID=A0AAD6T340_9AGAR|nr:hypothetical protein C8F04DRAFT_361436 [Mycena alexandri]
MGSPHSFIRTLSVLTALLLACAPSVNGAITNTTFDDTSSAFTFTGSWTPTSSANPCAGCSSKPNASQTFNETWHDGNCRTTTGGSFTFTGFAVYIFGIDQAESQPDITFTLGNVQSVHHYTGAERFVYNALFFSATGLAGDQTHTVNWIFNNDPTTNVGVQAALFDYAVVTSGTDVAVTPQDNPLTTSAGPKILTSASLSQAPSSSSSSSTIGVISALSSLSSTPIPASQLDTPPPTATVTVAGAVITLAPQSATSETHHSNVASIVGPVLGALVCAALALVLFCLFRRRKQRHRACADEERQAAGLPPALPRMRRIRNYTLQPFVDDRPPDMPAGSVMAGNVFATGALAHASSAGDVSTSPEALPAVSALDTSIFIAGGAFSPFTASGMSSAAFDVSVAASTNGPPPAFVDTAATVGRYPAEETPMQEVGYPKTHQVSRQASRSTQSDLSRHDEKGAVHEVDTVRGAMFSAAPADGSSSARERYLEQRLATLEAHVASYLPPPYEHPEL